MSAQWHPQGGTVVNSPLQVGGGRVELGGGTKKGRWYSAPLEFYAELSDFGDGFVKSPFDLFERKFGEVGGLSFHQDLFRSRMQGFFHPG